MIRKLIGSNFEIDLKHRGLSVQRQNHWFSEDFFTKFTLPFDLELTPELDEAFGYISRSNSTTKNTMVECKYYHGNVIEDAILEIYFVEDKISCNLNFGFDQLPNWESKLSELSLHKFELPEGVDIYAYAEGIIPQNYPDVDFNFPQIHTDKIDVENDDNFFAFERIINNYKDGNFLINEVIEEGGDSVTYNRNIMQPLPNWLYVLKTGFADAGLELAGDILNDEKLKKKWIYGNVDYATTVTQESIQDIAMSEDAVSFGTGGNALAGFYETANYFKSIPIVNPGRYRIVGKITIYRISRYVHSNFKIKYRSQTIFSGQSIMVDFVSKITLNVNVVFDTLADELENLITIESCQKKTQEKIIWDLAINPIRLHDDAGEPIPTLINMNQIDLTKSVPDMTFGEFVKANKHWYNYTLTVEGNKAIMNKVQNVMRQGKVVDLSMFEKKFPKRYFQKGISMLLKFADVDSKDYKFLPVFQNKDGVVNSGYKENDKTTTIEINALPLPLLMRNNVQTAHAFESNSSKLYVVIYDGLTAGLNLAKDAIEYLLPVVHEQNFKDWFQVQIDSEMLNEAFICDDIKLLELTPESKVYMYGKYHVVKTINDTEVKPGIFDIELELVSLE